MHSAYRQRYKVFWLACLSSALVSCGGGGSAPANTAPTATALAIADSNNGAARVGDILTATYSYTDADNDAEGNSQLVWLRDANDIPGATAASYILQPEDAGHTVAFELKPKAMTGVRNGSDSRSAAVAVDMRSGTQVPVQTLQSAYTGRTYSIDVLLPEGYATSAAPYPAIYQLSPHSTFINNAATIDAAAKDVILVSFGHSDNALRLTDYPLPGARDFFKFITLELLPFIEAQYRVDSKQRIISGHSAGGLFVGLALLLEDPQNRLFTGYLISDGGFQRNAWLTQNLERQLAAVTNELPAQVLVVAATKGAQFANLAFTEMLESRGYDQLDLTYIEYNVSHAEVNPLAFADGLDRLVP